MTSSECWFLIDCCSSDPLPEPCQLLFLVLFNVLLVVPVVHWRLVLECKSVPCSDIVFVLLGWRRVHCWHLGLVADSVELGFNCTIGAHPLANPQLILSQILTEFPFEIFPVFGSQLVDRVGHVVIHKGINFVLVLRIREVFVLLGSLFVLLVFLVDGVVLDEAILPCLEHVHLVVDHLHFLFPNLNLFLRRSVNCRRRLDWRCRLLWNNLDFLFENCWLRCLF